MPSDHEVQAISMHEAKSYISSGYEFVWERDGNGTILCWVKSADGSTCRCCRRRDFVDLLHHSERVRKQRQQAVRIDDRALDAYEGAA